MKDFANQGSAAAAGEDGDKAQADDMFDEFLMDEDMTNLEVIGGDGHLAGFCDHTGLLHHPILRASAQKNAM